MRTKYLFVLMCVAPMLASATDLYKYVDADGHVTYSSSPIKGGKKLNLEPLPTMAPLSKGRTPSDFPKVDNETQKGRDETRRKILQDELKAEQKLLEESKQNLQNAEAQNHGDATSNGKHVHNDAVAQQYAAEVSKQQDAVSMHQQNIDALNAELSKLK